MCGIAGLIANKSFTRGKEIVDAIIRRQAHRGPDCSAVEDICYAPGHLILGHNRLSIIDLSPEANQPFWDTDKNFAIIFNGEVYNYIEVREELLAQGVRFRTQSDTEVIIEALKLWREAALPKFIGMFAFAFYDSLRGELWLVRDRFGVKPLHIFEADGCLAFCSEPRQLAESFGLKPNMDYLARGSFSWNFDDDPEITQYAGVRNLLPGHILKTRVINNRVEAVAQPYYNLRENVEELRSDLAGRSQRDVIDRVAATLDSATELRLRADVPVAIALSGGLDSSSVAALVARDHKEVKGFTFGDPNDASTEGPIVKHLIDKIGLDVRFINPDQNTIFASYRKTLEAQDAPYVSGAQAMHYLVCQAVGEEKYKVVLGGQGGDEGYMGYRKFFLFCLNEARRKKDFAKSAFFLTQLGMVMAGEGSRLKNFWKHRGRFNGKAEPGEPLLKFPATATPPALGLAARQQAWERQMLDVTRFSLPTLLRYEDRNSMAHSLEGRLPFLDHRMLELGLAMPDSMKIRQGYGKWAVREAVKGLVPDEIRRARYKMGFSINQHQWIQNGLGDVLRKQLADVWPSAKEFVRPAGTAETIFTNERLISDVNAVPAMLSLIWLGWRMN